MCALIYKTIFGFLFGFERARLLVFKSDGYMSHAAFYTYAVRETREMTKWFI